MASALQQSHARGRIRCSRQHLCRPHHRRTIVVANSRSPPLPQPRERVRRLSPGEAADRPLRSRVGRPRASLLAHTTHGHTGCVHSAWGGRTAASPGEGPMRRPRPSCRVHQRLPDRADHTADPSASTCGRSPCPTGTVAYGGGGTSKRLGIFDQTAVHLRLQARRRVLELRRLRTRARVPGRSAWRERNAACRGPGSEDRHASSRPSPARTRPFGPAGPGARCSSARGARPASPLAGGAWYHLRFGSTHSVLDGYCGVRDER
jgi:hypothetical protein